MSKADAQVEDRRPERLSLAAYCLLLAVQAATRSTCLKKHVGCVITDKKGRVVATGYNGSPAGMSHCLDEGCLVDAKDDCVNTIHAEINALLSAYGRGRSMWCTDQPCLPCLHACLATGIRHIVYIKSSNKPDRDLFVSHHRLVHGMVDAITLVTANEYRELQDAFVKL